MARPHILFAAILFTAIVVTNGLGPTLFLSAITSALSTIPFTGGPMTTGIVGAKLAIGTKLLYYLGVFGKKSKPKAVIPVIAAKPIGLGGIPKAAVGGIPMVGMGGMPFTGMQPVPLPYALFGGMGGGGYQQEFGGPNLYQTPFGNFDPAVMFQALAARGIDPNTYMANYSPNNYGNQGMGFNPAMQNVNPGSVNVVPSGPVQNMNIVGGGAVGQGTPVVNAGNADFDENGITESDSTQSDDSDSSSSQGEGSEDVESFFTFLRDMDENTCISRLMCDIGADPSFLGEFSENIHSIVRSLDVQPTSGAYPYIEVMENGRKEGRCGEVFPTCTDSAYEIVKNVAPTVSIPQS